MENNKNYFNTYKFFNRKGQRLSIFATTKEGVDSTGITCGLSIYIVTCSKQDKFNKRLVREAFEFGQHIGSFSDSGINPTIINLPCTTGDSKRVFMQFCNKNFYKLYTQRTYGSNIGVEFDYLAKIDYINEEPETIILPSTFRKVRTIPYTPTPTIDPLLAVLESFMNTMSYPMERPSNN